MDKSASGGVEGRVEVPGNSPWFAGHFPGDPILPGISQIGMVIDCIAAVDGCKVYPAGLSRVKFRKIVRPGEILDIYALYDNKRNRYVFRISSDGEDVCSGMLCYRENLTPTG
jgi:3-hydroxymyristoyl/3-hydroxydecanoyl-(acyl carrier protein) dehydratase